jgi:hypothetical protein
LISPWGDSSITTVVINVPCSEEMSSLKTLAESYGKVIITWNPNDKAPIFPAQEIQVQHPFMVNVTVNPEIEMQA